MERYYGEQYPRQPRPEATPEQLQRVMDALAWLTPQQTVQTIRVNNQ